MLCLRLVRLALLQSRPPRALRKAAASAVQALLGSVFRNEAAEAKMGESHLGLRRLVAVQALLGSVFRNEAAEAKMALALQVVSSDHFGAAHIYTVLSATE